MNRGELSISDLLRSLAHLKPGSPEALEALCAMLHIELPREPVPAPVALESESLEPTPAVTEVPPRTAPEEGPSELLPLPAREEAPLPWADIEPLAAQPQVTERPKLEPLLLPLRRSALLSTAIATRDEAREVDVERTLDALSTGRLLRRLPRFPVPSLRRGVQVLADVSEGMLPYASDRGELVAAIQRLVGEQQTELAMFAGTPLRRAGRGLRHKWHRWTPPPRGTPVLLLTDLGIGGPLVSHDRAPLGEWLRFCEEVRRAGCPLAAFVPYERRRWPVELTKLMTLLPWDRGTTVLAIRHAVSPGPRNLP